MTTKLEIEDELRAVLHRQAMAVSFPDRPFDPAMIVEVSGRSGPRSSVRWLAVAASIAALVIGAAAALVLRSSTDDSVAVATPDGVLLSSRSTLADDEWVVPAAADGFVVDIAMMHAPEMRNTTFVAADDPSVKVFIDIGPLGQTFVPDDVEWSDVDIAGVPWSMTTSGTAVLTRDIGGRTVQVRSITVPADRLIGIAGRLRVVPEAGLGLPVLKPSSPDGWTDVATTSVGTTATLRAISDGRHYCLFIAHAPPGSATSAAGGGCGDELAEGDAITRPGGESSSPENLAPDEAGTSILTGLARSDVASLEVLLRDGTTISTVPQDLSGRFPLHFYIVVVPNHGFDLLDEVVKITAISTDGTILQTIDPKRA